MTYLSDNSPSNMSESYDSVSESDFELVYVEKHSSIIDESPKTGNSNNILLNPSITSESSNIDSGTSGKNTEIHFSFLSSSSQEKNYQKNEEKNFFLDSDSS